MIVGKDVYKSFGKTKQVVLHGLNFEIQNGEFVSISGRSGSGKSTLLYIISTLDLPTQGFVSIDGKDISKMQVDEVHEFRNDHIGFIFQFHYLLPELNAIENILLPPRNKGKQNEYLRRAQELLEKMNVSHVAHKFPGQMSGGEQQRVAIARALIMSPKYLFADEPTGNLDSSNGEIVMDIIKEVNQKNGTTVCLVTHESEYSRMADREIFLSDGKIVESL